MFRGLRMRINDPDASTLWRIMKPLLEDGTYWDIVYHDIKLLCVESGEPRLDDVELARCVLSANMEKLIARPVIALSGRFARYPAISDIYLDLMDFDMYMESRCEIVLFVRSWNDYELYIKNDEERKFVEDSYGIFEIPYERITGANDTRRSFRCP